MSQGNRSKLLVWLLACTAGYGMTLGGGLTHASTRLGRDQWIGVSAPSRAIQIAPEQSGIIGEPMVTESTVVAPGQELFHLESEFEELEVEQRKEIATCDVELRRALAEMLHAERKEARMRALVERSISSAGDLEDIHHRAVIARLRHERARLEHRLAEIEWRKARSRLAHRTMHSPIAGLVSRIMKRRGEAVEKDTPVLEIVALDPLWVEFDCPVQLAGKLETGARLRVRPAMERASSRIATVVLSAVRANPASHTYRVRLSVPNEGNTWKAGLKMFIDPPLPIPPLPVPDATPPRGARRK